MKNNFTLCYSKGIKKDLKKFKKFKHRYLEIISGRRTPNDDEKELERIGVLLDIQMVLENLVCSLKNAEKQ